MLVAPTGKIPSTLHSGEGSLNTSSTEYSLKRAAALALVSGSVGVALVTLWCPVLSSINNCKCEILRKASPGLAAHLRSTPQPNNRRWVESCAFRWRFTKGRGRNHRRDFREASLRARRLTVFNTASE